MYLECRHIKVASSNAKIPADLVALQQVREHSENEEGDELAPEIATYKPDDEEYQEANHEPTLTEILVAEVRRQREEEEDEARQSAETPKFSKECGFDLCRDS